MTNISHYDLLVGDKICHSIRHIIAEVTRIEMRDNKFIYHFLILKSVHSSAFEVGRTYTLPHLALNAIFRYYKPINYNIFWKSINE